LKVAHFFERIESTGKKAEATKKKESTENVKEGGPFGLQDWLIVLIHRGTRVAANT
jgi:hypothetical protein